MVVEAEDGKLYFVKLRAGLSGDLAAISEWVCCHIAVAVRLPVLSPVLIFLDATLDMADIHIEVRELIRKSSGLNLAFPYLDSTEPFHPKPDTEEEALLRRLFLFDLIFLNIDRNDRNLNLIRRQGKICSFDYEASFLIKGGIERKNFCQEDRVSHVLRHNPLYREGIRPEELESELALLRTAPLEEIISAIPNEWIAGLDGDLPAFRNRLASGIRRHWDDASSYLRLLERIGQLPLETEEARKARMLANRQAFEQKVKDFPT